METTLNILEDLFHEKIMLYQELVKSLQRERALLKETDMDQLWDISMKKQSLVSRIETVRSRILETLSEASFDHDMDVASFSLATVLSLLPPGARDRLRTVYLSLMTLKTETRQRSQENKLFVEQRLDFLDELINIIANTDRAENVYDKSGTINGNGPANMLLSSEV